MREYYRKKQPRCGDSDIKTIGGFIGKSEDIAKDPGRFTCVTADGYKPGESPACSDGDDGNNSDDFI